MRYPSKLAQILLVIGSLVSCWVSAPALAQGGAKEILDERIHRKLDRILTPEEYLTDIRLESAPAGAMGSNTYLPGLQVLGAVKDIPELGVGRSDMPIQLPGKADLLIVFDRKVSKERLQVAQDIVSRLLETENLQTTVKVTVKQQDINKIPPPVVPPAPPKEAKEPSLMEQLIHQKDFVARALMVLWGAIASLMAIHLVLRRVVGVRAISEPRAKSADELGRLAASQVQSGMPSPNGKATNESPQKVAGYSKDEALLSGIKEIVEEAKAYPKKVARVLTRWVSQSEENARYAALFIKNCDIKTIEAICNSLHPSDLDKIINHEINDFNPLDSENQKVLDRMRADLAVLASEHLLKERPDPLDFLRVLSDDDIRSLLEGEDLRTVALVSTQIPPHRMQKFFDSLAPNALSAIISQVSTIQAASLTDFEEIRERLSAKAEKLGANLFNDKARASAMLQLIASVRSPLLQYNLLETLQQQNSHVYNQIRPDVFLATDLAHLSDRMWSVFVQSVDADTLGTALSEVKHLLGEIAAGMAPAYQTVFQDAVGRRYESEGIVAAWAKVNSAVKELINNGLITKQEVAGTIRRAESARIDAQDAEVAPTIASGPRSAA